MSKFVYALFFLAVIVSAMVFVGGVKASTPISGLLMSDTTWSLANSPYQLTGPVGVANGVTLTIEPGVTVNLDTYSIQVNGTIIAKGTSTEKIILNSNHKYHSVAIDFLPYSASWDATTSSGSIIQNVAINAQSAAICIQNVAPKIDSNSITGTYIVVSGGLPTISNNQITGEIHITEGSPTITGNEIKGLIVGAGTGTTIISNNKLTGNFGDTVEGAGISCSSTVITDNVITQFQKGILDFKGVSRIERNVIVNNVIGIQVGQPNVGYTGGLFQVTIQNNQITNNAKGISITDLHPSIQNANFKATITNNNIQNNINYNLYLGATMSIDAANNWWGTTDIQAINQTIYDVKNDFNFGTVTFVPFLTEPDPNTPSASADILTTPTPTSTPEADSTQTPTPTPIPIPTENPNPTQTPQQPRTQSEELVEFDCIKVAVILLCIAVAGLTVALVVWGRRSARHT